MSSKILIVDDEEVIRFAYKRHLSKVGYSVVTAADYPTALDIISKTDLDVIVADVILGHHTGIDILEEIKRLGLSCPVIMVTGEPNITTAMDAVRLGAFDYLPKPVRKEMLLGTTRVALKHKMLLDEKEAYRQNLEAIFSSIKEAVVTVDPNLHVLAANAAVKDVFGVKETSMIGKQLKSIPIFSRKQCCQVLEQTLQTLKPLREQRVESHEEGRNRRVLILNSSLLSYGSNRVKGAILVARDVTRLTILERELNVRYRFHNIIGKSSPMQKIYNLLEDLANTETTVLITGESGTGKELAARALHYEGPRAEKPMVVANCSVFAENLLESELFGHVQGAFTGAIKDKIGRFEQANGGTLFLDEVGEISPLIQLKLLRVLQEREIEKVGSNSSIPVDVRVIAATHRNLKRMVSQGEFRKDLYYRLNVVEVRLPQLRKRLEDIPILVDHICKKMIRKMNIKFDESGYISKEVMEIFMKYSWPGNVRELENALEHAFVLCHNKSISKAHLPLEIQKYVELGFSDHPYTEMNHQPENEKETLIRALKISGWNKAKAARLLSINRRTIYRKIEKFNITLPTS